METPSLMHVEARAAASLVALQRQTNRATIERLVASLHAKPPRFVVTLARGSSDNAATYARYLIERQLGCLTGSLSPSVSSVYSSALDFTGSLLIAVSQSGRSPDIVGTARSARARGARIVALVNDETSPLAAEADFFLHIGAGPECSVAATKTFTLSLVALLDFIAKWSEDGGLRTELDMLPERLEASFDLDWSTALAPLRNARNMFVVARGHAYGVAQEMALKLKETCSIHGEAISAAEVRHGPMALVDRGFPILFIGQNDASLSDTSELAHSFSARGAQVMHSGLNFDGGVDLPCLEADPRVQPILQVQSFYRFCEELARARGFDPDRPPYLNKVTQTV